MSKTRKQIEAKIQKNNDLIAKLKQENNDLYYESFLISDKEQRYIEEERDVVVSKRPKVTKKVLFGMIQWDEYFIDEDTGKIVTIQRHKVVKQDGVWVV